MSNKVDSSRNENRSFLGLTSAWQLAALLSLPVILLLAWQLRAVVILALLSLLLAFGLAPAVAALQRRKIPRPLAIAFFYLSIALIIGGLAFAAGSIIATESDAFLTQMSEWMDQWKEVAAENSLLAPPESIQNLLPVSSLRIAGSGLTGLGAVLLILLVTYYLLLDGGKLWTRALLFSPVEHRSMLDLLGHEIAHRTRGYMSGVGISALVIGLLTGLGLWLLGIPYPLFFAVLAGFLEAVPMIGPMLAALGPVLLALGLHGPLLAGLVLLFFAVLQQVEDKVLVVRIQSRATGLHPLGVIFSMLVLGVLFGLGGLLLAIPVAAAIQASLVCWHSCVYHPGGSAAWVAERQGAGDSQ